VSKSKDILMHPAITIPGDIPSHPRPRISNKRAYYPPKYKKFQHMAEFILRHQWQGKKPLDNALQVEILFLCTKPKSKIRKTTKDHRLPKCRSREDIDNQIKSVLDALQAAGIIKNDNLVYSITAEAWFAGIEEKIEAKISITEVLAARWTTN